MTKRELNSLLNPCPDLTVEQKWELLKEHAPEAWAFYERVTTGDLNSWWQDKPLQLFIRSILYIGQIKAELGSAHRRGMEEAAGMCEGYPLDPNDGVGYFITDGIHGDWTRDGETARVRRHCAEAIRAAMKEKE